jgi:adenylate cyclase, class 2
MPKFVEQEAKFRIADIEHMRTRLESSGAQLILNHQHEMNTRFDKADGSLKAAREVLRLRVDEGVRLTYKGAANPDAEVSVRKEIELKVDDAQAAAAFLENLGYTAVESYEKYRSTYHVAGAEIVLDELPYGNFIEIEGESEERIHDLALGLGLAWEKRCKLSYLELFYRLKEKSGQKNTHLTFDAFSVGTDLQELLEAEIADD